MNNKGQLFILQNRAWHYLDAVVAFSLAVFPGLAVVLGFKAGIVLFLIAVSCHFLCHRLTEGHVRWWKSRRYRKTKYDLGTEGQTSGLSLSRLLHLRSFIHFFIPFLAYLSYTLLWWWEHRVILSGDWRPIVARSDRSCDAGVNIYAPLSQFSLRRMAVILPYAVI